MAATVAKLTRRRFADAQHALVAPCGQPHGVVDDALERHGQSGAAG